MPKKEQLEKKALNELEKSKKEQEEDERRESASWNVGSKDSSKAALDAAKEEEKRRKAAEKATILAEEEANNAGIKKAAGSKLKKKGKDDFDLLNAALANAPKTKAQKEAEAKKKLDEEKKKIELEAREKKEAQKKAAQDEIRKNEAKGIVMNHTDELLVPINNHLNEEDFDDATGLDAALDLISMGSGSGGSSDHPEKRMKAAYNAYYEYQLPMLKEEYPNLKLSQYKERIFDKWQKAPENPKNIAKRTSGETVWKMGIDGAIGEAEAI